MDLPLQGHPRLLVRTLGSNRSFHLQHLHCPLPFLSYFQIFQHIWNFSIRSVCPFAVRAEHFPQVQGRSWKQAWESHRENLEHYLVVEWPCLELFRGVDVPREVRRCFTAGGSNLNLNESLILPIPFQKLLGDSKILHCEGKNALQNVNHRANQALEWFRTHQETKPHL